MSRVAYCCFVNLKVSIYAFFEGHQIKGGRYMYHVRCGEVFVRGLFDLFEVEHTVDYDIDLLLYIPPIDTR